MEKLLNWVSRWMNMLKIGLLIGLTVVLLPCHTYGVDWCGGYNSPGNPYPCCPNGGNCTWWAWRQAQAVWGDNLPGAGNARYWASVLGSNPYNYSVSSTPAVDTIACNTTSSFEGVVYGHVAWVTRIVGNVVYFTDMDCCSTCKYGASEESAPISYFDGGFIYPKGSGTNLCGNLGGRTLTAGTTYTVTCDIRVDAGQELIIQKGAILNGFDNFSFTVNGKLTWGTP